MKKKGLLFLLMAVLILPFSFVLTGCGDKYKVKLTKSFDKNGFEIQTTEDYVLEETTEGIRFSSEGDDKIFDSTTMFGQYDFGNKFYSVATKSVSDYANDIAKIENINLSTPTIVKTKERKADSSLNEVALSEYIICENINPTGNWDRYEILFFGKTEKAFVYFNFSTQIENKNLNKWTKKCETIINSAILKPVKDISYDEFVEAEISNTIVSTGKSLNALGYVFHIPYDYILTPSDVAWLNYLSTSYALEERWSSTIMFEALGSFNGVYYADKYGEKNLIKYSSENLLGYYIKEESKNSDNTLCTTYYFYFLDENNSIMCYSPRIAFSCSTELREMGFGKYFEQQMIEWIKNIEIVSE